MNIFKNRITKYLNTHIFVAFSAFFLVISLIVFGNQFFLVLNRSLSEGYLGSELIPLMVFKYLRDTPFVISFSFSLAITYSLNKLYKSSELIILANSGFGDYKLFKILLPMIASIFFVVSMISAFLVPEVNKEINYIKNDANSRPDYIFFKEGVFQNFKNESITFYADSTENNKENQAMKNIFLFLSEENKFLLSKTGEKIFDKQTGKVFLRLYNGNIYQNIDKKSIGETTISDFKKFEILIYEPNFNNENKANNSIETKNIISLFINHDSKSLKELFFRISISVALLVMSYLSIQLSRSSPRKKRNYSLGYGLLCYIGYYNLLLYAREIRELNSYEIMMTFISAHLPFLDLVFIIYFSRKNFSIRWKF